MFNVDETVLLAVKITDIRIDNKGVRYRITYRNSSGDVVCDWVKEEALRKEIM